MNLKYILVAVILLVGGLFYFMYQSNQADVERLKQAEIAHQKKIEQEKIEAINASKTAAEKKAQAELDRIKFNEATQKAEQDKERAQIEVAAQKVKDNLIDSDSAKFRNQKGNCGEVNAKNRMGGYTGFSRYIYFPEDKSLVIESEAKDAIFTPQIVDRLWSIKCN